MDEEERYLYRGQKKLRRGYTTGSCAAAAAKAAVYALLSGKPTPRVSLLTPKGISLSLCAQDFEIAEEYASCAVKKDSGDDPDVTDGILIYARVERADETTVEGGAGIGRVTKQGLDRPVGEAAINRVPLWMIEEAAREAREELGYPGGFRITISAPGGESIAQKTYNPRLGIVGGISVLGTSGIVEPMSEQALVDSILLELKIRRAEGKDTLLITPGNYGEQFVAERYGIDGDRCVKCSNFVGETIDQCVGLGFRGILLVGHIGKFSKLAAGIMNTHSRYADGRAEIVAAYAALCGAKRALLEKIMEAVTTDEMLDLLEQAEILRPTLEKIISRAGYQVGLRAAGKMDTGVVIFSNKRGLLGKTEGAASLLEDLMQTEDKK